MSIGGKVKPLNLNEQLETLPCNGTETILSGTMLSRSLREGEAPSPRLPTCDGCGTVEGVNKMGQAAPWASSVLYWLAAPYGQNCDKAHVSVPSKDNAKWHRLLLGLGIICHWGGPGRAVWPWDLQRMPESLNRGQIHSIGSWILR